MGALYAAEDAVKPVRLIRTQRFYTVWPSSRIDPVDYKHRDTCFNKKVTVPVKITVKKPVVQHKDHDKKHVHKHSSAKKAKKGE